MEIIPVDLLQTAAPVFDSLLLYIDPGSGSAVISAIIGLFIAIGIALKTYWYKIKQLFSGSTSSKEDTSSESTTND